MLILLNIHIFCIIHIISDLKGLKDFLNDSFEPISLQTKTEYNWTEPNHFLVRYVFYLHLMDIVKFS